MKVIAIVQARMGSSRLPGKVMKKVSGMTLIEILLKRLSKANSIDQIVVATSDNPADASLKDHVEELGFHCIIGSENDVLDRFIVAGKSANADVVIRITGDFP